MESRLLSMDEKPSLIAVHGGVFHADEVLGIALIRQYFCSDIPYTRTREEDFIADAKKKKDVWLVDVGLELNFEMNNLDHHQDASLLGATIYVANKLWNKVPAKFEKLIHTVSAWDVNHNDIHSGVERGGCISQFFKYLNNYGGFDEALSWATKLLNALTEETVTSDIFSVKDAFIVPGLKEKWDWMLAQDILKEAEWEKKYSECKSYPVRNGEVLLMGDFFPWQRFAKDTNERMNNQGVGKLSMIIGAIFYDSLSNGWRIASIDSNLHPIPTAIKHMPGFVFLHPKQFIAGFETENQAKIAVSKVW